MHFDESGDVVNEAIEDGGAPARNGSAGLKPSFPWYPAVPDYVDIAFNAAKTAAGPSGKVKLFYNDYSAEGGWVQSTLCVTVMKAVTTITQLSPSCRLTSQDLVSATAYRIEYQVGQGLRNGQGNEGPWHPD